MSNSEKDGEAVLVQKIIDESFAGDAFAALEKAAENLHAKDAREQMQIVPQIMEEEKR